MYHKFFGLIVLNFRILVIFNVSHSVDMDEFDEEVEAVIVYFILFIFVVI